MAKIAATLGIEGRGDTIKLVHLDVSRKSLVRFVWESYQPVEQEPEGVRGVCCVMLDRVCLETLD